jgi:hypothetical protein
LYSFIVNKQNEQPEERVDKQNEQSEERVDTQNEQPKERVDKENEQPEERVDKQNEQPEVLLTGQTSGEVLSCSNDLPFDKELLQDVWLRTSVTKL